jgi:hypothetical protein
MLRVVSAASTASVVFLFHAASAAAGLLPAQGDICSAIPASGQSTTVSKRLVANYVLTGNTAAIKRLFGDPVWNSIFTQEDEQFCATSAVCRGVTGDACKKEVDACKLSRASAVIGAENLLAGLAVDASSKDPSFRMSPALANLETAARMRTYFATASDGGIECVAPKSAKASQSPAAADSSPLRVRGLSNDLLYDRSNASAFSAASQATFSVTGDHSTATQSETFKVTGAVGYAFQTSLAEVVPYVSFNQSITDVTGKPSSTDPTSFVAGGMMFTATVPGDVLVQTISAKPQYLENTKDHSQIDSMTLIYKPYTGFDVSNGGFNLNDWRPLPFWHSAYGQVLFDLRSDLGQYTDRGDNPVQRLLNQSYARAGTHVGFSLTTDPAGPSFTLTVEETYLYGFAGSVRNLDLFHTQLTYNFDAKKYVGITASYSKGRNEDTALPTQTWTVGLSAKY